MVASASGAEFRRPIIECDVLNKDHHEGYISWEEFERNQHVIADNAMRKASWRLIAVQGQRC